MSATSVEDVIELFEQWGSHPYDEALGQLAHALQTAALAVDSGASDALVGHLLDLRSGPGPSSAGRAHEDTGAAWLRPLFPGAVTAPIALHVRAKRYLCAVEPSYIDGLSAGSAASLTRQGGPMSTAEVAAFETVPGYGDAVRIRRFDDAGKVDGSSVPALDDYVEVLRRLTTLAPQ